MARLLGVAAAVVAVLAMASASGGSTGAGTIVFSATDVGAASSAAQLYAIQPSGAGLKQLTTGASSALDPAISPAGVRVAFVRFGYGIFVVNSDRSGLKRLTTNPRDSDPTWSPDGTRVAFVRPEGKAWRLYVVSVKGGAPKRLATPPAGRPTWTTAGLLVPTGGDLIRVDPKTGKVLKYFGADIDAIWGLHSVNVSAGTTQLTYVGTRSPEPGDMECGDGPCQRFGLYYERLTTKVKKGKLIVKDATAGAFSPDGKRLVYIVGGQLVIRSVATGQTTALATPTVAPSTLGPPAWR